MYPSHVHRFFVPTTVFVVALLCSSTAHALKTTITGEMSKLDGHTTYAIGGDFSTPSRTGLTWFPVRKLEFPLDIGMNIAKFELVTDNAMVFSLSVEKSANSKAGKTKRSDWMDSAGSLDVYSQSDSKLDAEVYDLSFKIKKEIRPIQLKRVVSVPKVNKDVYPLMAAVGFGVRYQEFDYQVGNTVKRYPLNPSAGVTITNGLTRTYNVQYTIPYINLLIHKPLSKQWLLGFDFSYSPFVRAKDEDHYLESNPPIVSKGTADGSMYSGLFFTRFIITKQIYVEGKLSYVSINTSGTQTQHYEDSGEWIADIDTEITSEQYNFGLSYNFTF